MLENRGMNPADRGASDSNSGFPDVVKTLPGL